MEALDGGSKSLACCSLNSTLTAKSRKNTPKVADRLIAFNMLIFSKALLVTLSQLVLMAWKWNRIR